MEPDDVASVQDEISSLKSKLEECKTQLQSNEQMIRWLNNQVACTDRPWHDFLLRSCFTQVYVALRETCIGTKVTSIQNYCIVLATSDLGTGSINAQAAA